MVGKWSQFPLQPSDFGFDEYMRFQASGKYWNTQPSNKSYTKKLYCVTILEGGDIGDVYRYQNGLLQYHTQDDKSTLTDAGLCELPGTRVPDSLIPYPTLSELKRIHISRLEPPNLKVISFMLPHRADNDNLPFALNFIPGSYFYSQLPKLKLVTIGNATFIGVKASAF